MDMDQTMRYFYVFPLTRPAEMEMETKEVTPSNWNRPSDVEESIKPSH